MRKMFLSVFVLSLLISCKEKETPIALKPDEAPGKRFNRLPTSTTGQIIHHANYTLSYAEAFEQAEWVAYELKKTDLSNTQFERPFFIGDDKVKTKSADWRNYKKSGYDKGHLCPAGDRKFSKAAFDETFLTSNIAPQKHNFNDGVWNRLEQKTRYWASKYNKVYVVTGGVLKPGLQTIGREKVAVPQHFYKIILDYNGVKPKLIGFLVPAVESREPLYTFVVAVDEIEKLTGIDFFPAMEDKLENELEQAVSYKQWAF